MLKRLRLRRLECVPVPGGMVLLNDRAGGGLRFRSAGPGEPRQELLIKTSLYIIYIHYDYLYSIYGYLYLVYCYIHYGSFPETTFQTKRALYNIYNYSSSI